MSTGVFIILFDLDPICLHKNALNNITYLCININHEDLVLGIEIINVKSSKVAIKIVCAFCSLIYLSAMLGNVHTYSLVFQTHDHVIDGFYYLLEINNQLTLYAHNKT